MEQTGPKELRARPQLGDVTETILDKHPDDRLVRQPEGPRVVERCPVKPLPFGIRRFFVELPEHLSEVDLTIEDLRADGWIGTRKTGLLVLAREMTFNTDITPLVSDRLQRRHQLRGIIKMVDEPE